MIADAISQLERREGMLPLSVEDRPRLSALLARTPDLLGGIRTVLALGARYFPVDSDVRLRVGIDPDDASSGEYVTLQFWLEPASALDHTMMSRFIQTLAEEHPEIMPLPIVVVEIYRSSMP